MVVRYYGGVGSRRTPIPIVRIMEGIGEYLARRGIRLRSGHAPHADQAFERGCDRVDPRLKEIYRAEYEETRHPEVGHIFTTWEMRYRLYDHPVYQILCRTAGGRMHLEAKEDGIRRLIERDAYQVLGQDLQTPIERLVCWTPGAKGGGGTKYACAVARAWHIPIHDLADATVYDRWVRHLNV